MTAFEAVEKQRLSLGRCPIHVQHNPSCSICKRISEDKNIVVPADTASREDDLQEKIEAECLSRGWPFARTRMDKATTFTFPGVPDFIIAADGGRTLWIECKAGLKKPTTEQVGFGMMLNRCGHVYHVVRAFSQFLEIIAPKPD